ncbi:MAG TPA: hypothetical protein VMY37_14085 [Thermoguttaceae bacterium]|nr:hypothetical protein [Thermoguttaceae bacterium]
MRRVSFLGEDEGHRAFLVPLLRCVAAQYGIDVEVREYSIRGGFGEVENELEQYVRDLVKFKEGLPDLVVVATDANCCGFARRRKKLERIVEPVKDRIAFAVPDPHIERWMLLDPSAFKAALGSPCKIPDQKCDRDRYKQLLLQAVQETGVTPLLGGIEHAEDIVRNMDLAPTSRGDDFGKFLQDIHACFRRWRADVGTA